MICHALAVRLGKTLGEIDAIPHEELVSWIAYFELEKERADNA
jgi:hypothetical protein